MKKEYFFPKITPTTPSQLIFIQEYNPHYHKTKTYKKSNLPEIHFPDISLITSFLTATQLKGGELASGITFLIWGYIVMDFDLLYLQIFHIFDYNIFLTIFGKSMESSIEHTGLILTGGYYLLLSFIKFTKSVKVNPS